MHSQQNIKLLAMFGQTKAEGFSEITPVFCTTQHLTLTKEDHNLNICHNGHLKHELANGHPNGPLTFPSSPPVTMYCPSGE
jgi:hypothetical protein